MAWLQPPALGCRFSFLHLPCGRCGHTMTTRAQSLVLFGGFDGRRRLNDMHLFDTASLVWTQPKTFGTSPHPRQYHTAAIIQDVLYLFGGYDGSSWPNELVALDFSDFTWRMPPASGDLPKGREGHAMCADGSAFYIHGGWDWGVVNDLHRYDTKNGVWTKLETTGEKPALCGHSLTLLGRTIYVFGGYDGTTWQNTLSTLDLDTLAWTQPPVVGSPLPRGYHSATAVNRYILVFAGYNGDFILGDLLALDTTTLTWSYPEPCFGRLPAARNAHSMTLLGSELYIFGGYNGSRDVNELHVLETAVFSTLYDDLRTAFYSGQWQDIRVFNSKSSHYIAAPILSVRCPVLYSQVTDNQVEVPDCTPEALTLFCENLYSDLHASRSVRSLEDLLFLAVKYDQPRLQALCFGSSHLLPDSSLVQDMLKCREALCDFNVTVQGKSFALHKFVVAARCPFFRALLDSGMRETLAQTVDLPQITAEAFEVVVEWIYTDKFAPLFGEGGLDLESGVNVLNASNMLGLTSLMRMTEIALQRIISQENVVQLYDIAHLVQATKLKSYALNFILREFDTISARRDFSTISLEAKEELSLYMPRRLRRQSSLSPMSSTGGLKLLEVTAKDPVSDVNKREVREFSPKQLNVQGVRAAHCHPAKAKVQRRRKELSPLVSPKRGKLAPLMQKSKTISSINNIKFDFTLTGSGALNRLRLAKDPRSTA